MGGRVVHVMKTSALSQERACSVVATAVDAIQQQLPRPAGRPIGWVAGRDASGFGQHTAGQAQLQIAPGRSMGPQQGAADAASEHRSTHAGSSRRDDLYPD